MKRFGVVFLVAVAIVTFNSIRLVRERSWIN